ncbi:aminotransferase class IV [Naasia sp. SYSU D00057]|uniref:aminotransferase class IV n=1 Tax=Naasia sp. SYSU D00057 TaxID=2817380 RepID=UPI001B30AE92|nr:aminotransferase class IV [Naasia sp. SYSU D00057]
MAAEVLRWREGRLVPASAGAPLLVADSFLLDAGTVVALDVHRDRFLRSIASAEVARVADGPVPLADATGFWSSAVAALPRQGAWFPRIELVQTPAGPEYGLAVRPAPPLGRLVTALTWDGPDPRRVPSVKGPDLEALLRLREAGRERGADEVVLLVDGAVAEGTTSSLAWWRDGVLCVPADDLHRVAGVTEACVIAMAVEAGVAVRRERRRPDELDACEVWVLNALHGIRGIERWAGGPAVTAPGARLDEWRSRLAALARPLPTLRP